MKLSSNPDKMSRDASNKLSKYFDYDELSSLVWSLLGCSDLMGRYLIQMFAKNKNEVPKGTVYGMLMFIQYLKTLSEIASDRIPEGEILKFLHMPTEEDAWKTDEDFEKRITIFVKQLYQDYSAQGKI